MFGENSVGFSLRAFSPVDEPRERGTMRGISLWVSLLGLGDPRVRGEKG